MNSRIGFPSALHRMKFHRSGTKNRTRWSTPKQVYEGHEPSMYEGYLPKLSEIPVNTSEDWVETAVRFIIRKKIPELHTHITRSTAFRHLSCAAAARNFPTRVTSVRVIAGIAYLLSLWCSKHR